MASSTTTSYADSELDAAVKAVMTSVETKKKQYAQTAEAIGVIIGQAVQNNDPAVDWVIQNRLASEVFHKSKVSIGLANQFKLTALSVVTLSKRDPEYIFDVITSYRLIRTWADLRRAVGWTDKTLKPQYLEALNAAVASQKSLEDFWDEIALETEEGRKVRDQQSAESKAKRAAVARTYFAIAFSGAVEKVEKATAVANSAGGADDGTLDTCEEAVKEWIAAAQEFLAAVGR